MIYRSLCTCPLSHSKDIPCYGYMDRDSKMTQEESDMWHKKAEAELEWVKSVVMRQTIENIERQTMDFNEYQKQCALTDKYPEAAWKVYMEIESIGGDPDIPLESINHLALLMYTLGLSGEAGEVSDKIKKIFRDKGGEFSPENAFEVVKELGDTLWYIALIGKELGYSLEQIAKINIDKLKVRAENNKIHGSGDNR